MEKPVFRDVVEQIVAGFEDPQFRSQYADAKAAGDVPRLLALALTVQRQAFARHGLDEAAGSAAFKEAGRRYGLDPDVMPLLARMKAAMGK